MTIYIILIILIIGLGLLSQLKQPFGINKNNRKRYIISISFLLAILSGLRDFSVGNDTGAYIDIFKLIGELDLDTAITASIGLEKGFVVYSWLIYKIFPNGHFYLFVNMSICSILIGFWLYKNAKHPIESFLIYVCVFFPFFLTGLRQSMAISVLLLAYEQIKKKNIVKFILIVCLAGTFHRTAFIFLIAYPFLRSKISKLKVTVIVVVILAFFKFRANIFLWVSPILGYEQYGILDHSDPIHFTILLYTITIFCVVLSKKITKINIQATYYINSLLLACILIPYAGLNGSMLRLVTYFSFYLVLLVPEVIYVFEGKEIKSLISMIVSFSLVFMFINNLISSTTYQFKFFF